jgi:hypothetical protein
MGSRVQAGPSSWGSRKRVDALPVPPGNKTGEIPLYCGCGLEGAPVKYWFMKYSPKSGRVFSASPSLADGPGGAGGVVSLRQRFHGSADEGAIGEHVLISLHQHHRGRPTGQSGKNGMLSPVEFHSGSKTPFGRLRTWRWLMLAC